jgi:integrase
MRWGVWTLLQKGSVVIDWIRPERLTEAGWPEALAGFWVLRYPKASHAESTLAKARQAIRWLQRIAPESPAQLTSESILDLIESDQKRGIQNESLRSVLTSARICCEWIADKGIISHDLINRRMMRLPPKDPTSREDLHLPTPEIQRMLCQSDSEFHGARSLRDRWLAARLRALVYLIAHTGLRKSEAIRLRRERWNQDTSEMKVTALDHPRNRTKTIRSQRRMYVPEIAGERIKEWLEIIDHLGGSQPHEWLFPGVRKDVPWVGGSGASRALNQIQLLAERADVKTHVTIHGLRHTFATHAVCDHGFTEAKLKLAMGHTNIATQVHYLHRDRGLMADMMSHFGYGTKSPDEEVGESTQRRMMHAGSTSEDQRKDRDHT